MRNRKPNVAALRTRAHRLGLTVTEDKRARTFKVHAVGNGHGGYIAADLPRVARYLDRAEATITVARAVQNLFRA